jgi:2-C-methyl-D-erythritol 4-phosphate cytidylyltransferase
MTDRERKMEIRNTAVLLAAGRGKRMNMEGYKQYLEIQGAPLFTYSLKALTESPVITDIVITVNEGDEDHMRAMVEQYGLSEKVRAVVHGGAERFLSVYEGLKAVSWPCDFVYVHDSARAFLDQETLLRLDRAARESGSAVAGVPSKDTVRITDDEGYGLSTPARKNVWIVQTPQVFRIEDILLAHSMAVESLDRLEAEGIQITDDAMVAETMLGIKARMVMASYNNIKVTTQEDLPLAEAILKGPSFR